MVKRALAAGLLVLTWAYGWGAVAAQEVSAESTCDRTCAAPSLVTPIAFSEHISKTDGELRADVAVRQPCACVRELNLSLVFTPFGRTRSQTYNVKLRVPQGLQTSHVVLDREQLAKLNVRPGQYTLGFGLRDERDESEGESVSGLLFTYGTPAPSFAAKPAMPARIERGAPLSVPFAIGNQGDIDARVTSLVVFTRPDDTHSVEVYSPQFVVPVGGTTRVMQLTAARRRELKIGVGPWLVTTAAFDAADQRLGFYPGEPLIIGNTLSQPRPARVRAPSAEAADLQLELTFKNDADFEDFVTAVLVFSKPGNAEPIEHKIEGIRLPSGTSVHSITLTALDRYNLGLRPGKWRITTTALDRGGKRLETRSAGDCVLPGPTAQLSSR